MISWSDFEKVDIRVGTIMEVNDFPNARKHFAEVVRLNPKDDEAKQNLERLSRK